MKRRVSAWGIDGNDPFNFSKVLTKMGQEKKANQDGEPQFIDGKVVFE